MKTFLFNLLLASVIFCFGQDDKYVRLGTTPDEMYLNKSTLKKNSDGTVKAWFKAVPVNLNERRVMLSNTKEGDFSSFAYSLQLIIVDCRNDKYKVIQNIGYDEKGNVIYRLDATEWTDTPPESLISVVSEALCKK